MSPSKLNFGAPGPQCQPEFTAVEGGKLKRAQSEHNRSYVAIYSTTYSEHKASTLSGGPGRSDPDFQEFENLLPEAVSDKKRQKMEKRTNNR